MSSKETLIRAINNGIFNKEAAMSPEDKAAFAKRMQEARDKKGGGASKKKDEGDKEKEAPKKKGKMSEEDKAAFAKRMQEARDKKEGSFEISAVGIKDKIDRKLNRKDLGLKSTSSKKPAKEKSKFKAKNETKQNAKDVAELAKGRKEDRLGLIKDIHKKIQDKKKPAPAAVTPVKKKTTKKAPAAVTTTKKKTSPKEKVKKIEKGRGKLLDSLKTKAKDIGSKIKKVLNTPITQQPKKDVKAPVKKSPAKKAPVSKAPVKKVEKTLSPDAYKAEHGRCQKGYRTQNGKCVKMAASEFISAYMSEASYSIIKAAKLVKKNNPNTDQKEWALRAEDDPDKILKWFGPKKPTEKEVEKEESRVLWFKHQG